MTAHPSTGKPGVGPQIPVPYLARAGVALALLVLWRPGSRATVAVVALPAFCLASFVLFVALPPNRLVPGARECQVEQREVVLLWPDGW